MLSGWTGDLPSVMLIGTGSEVSLEVKAHQQLSAEGVRSRLVSMPSWELFEAQTQSYRDSVLPPRVRARVTVEAGDRTPRTSRGGLPA